MKITIGRTIVAGLLLAQIATIALVLAWYFYSVRAELEKTSERSAQETVLRSIEATQDYFTPVYSVLQAGQNLVIRDVLNRDRPAQLVRFLHDQLQLQPQIAGIYVGYPDGEFYYVMRTPQEAANATRTKIVRTRSGQRQVELTWRNADFSMIRTEFDPADEYDPRARPWYKAAIESDQTAWTEPYIFFSSRKPGITAAIAIPGGANGPAGVVGVDLEISDISQALRRSAFGPQRSAFVMAADETVIAHSDLDTVLASNPDGEPRFRTLADLEFMAEPVRAQIRTRLAANAQSNVPAVWHVDTDQGDLIVAMGRISSPDWPWRIVATLPESEAADPTGDSAVLLFFAILLAVLLAGAVSFVLARSIGKPLAALYQNARYARRGNVELIEAVESGYKEIDETSRILAELGGAQRRGKQQ